MAAVPPPAARPNAVQTNQLGVGKVPVSTQAAVPAPTAGATVDAESRAAINLIIARLQAFGLIV